MDLTNVSEWIQRMNPKGMYVWTNESNVIAEVVMQICKRFNRLRICENGQKLLKWSQNWLLNDQTLISANTIETQTPKKREQSLTVIKWIIGNRVYRSSMLSNFNSTMLHATAGSRRVATWESAVGELKSAANRQVKVDESPVQLRQSNGLKE